MPFRITVLEEGASTSATVIESSQKARIGSDRSCDVRLKKDYILPIHCEIESHKMTHSLVKSPLADVQINGMLLSGKSAALADGDKIQLGEVTLLFNVTRHTVKRHWRTDLVSYSAISLLVVMLVFESLVMFWLPARLSSDKAWEREQTLQEVIELLDRTRAVAREISVKDKNDEGFLHLFNMTLDETARYVRAYKDTMTRSQIAEVREDLKRLEPFVSNWNKLRKKYVKEEVLDQSSYAAGIISKIEGTDPK